VSSTRIFFLWFSYFVKIVEHGDVSFQLVTGRVWRGSAFGGVKGRTELPGIVEGENLLRSSMLRAGLTSFSS
jgi:hypothetical protein